MGARGKRYLHRLLIDGNDPRNIDVAVLSVFPIVASRTWRHLRDSEGRADLFSRDCLEVEFSIDGRPLVLYANHLKSMLGGRGPTRGRRAEQSAMVRTLAEHRFGAELSGNVAILGDMNDFPQSTQERGETVTTGLSALLDHPELVNIVDRLPNSERWTHWYNGGKRGERARQLDYIFLGSELDHEAGKPTPGIERRGLPWRAEEDYPGPRFPEVGEDDPKASDHCPVYVDIPVAALDRDGGGRRGQADTGAVVAETAARSSGQKVRRTKVST